MRNRLRSLALTPAWRQGVRGIGAKTGQEAGGAVPKENLHSLRGAREVSQVTLQEHLYNYTFPFS